MTKKFGVKEVVDGTFYDYATGKPALFLDTLKLSNLENNAETSYIQGGQGNPRIMAFDYNRTATFNIQDALMNPTSLAMQSGTEVIKEVAQAHKREALVAVAGDTAGSVEVSLAEAPLDGSVTVYKAGDFSAEITPTTVAQVLVIDEVDLAVGEEVEVFYQYETSAETEQVIISSDKYGGYYKFVGSTIIRNAKTNKDEAFEIEMPKVKIMSNWTLNMSPEGEPAVFDMALDCFKELGSTEMVKLKMLGEVE
jgi:hypothetical protein